METLLATEIGKVSINSPIKFRDQSYECAAWWEERLSTTGVFPLLLKKVNHYTDDYVVYAEIPAVVTDEYFPALFHGVAVGTSPYKPSRIGQQTRPVKVQESLVKAILLSGRSTSPDIDWYIDRKHWHSCLTQRKSRLLAHKQYLDQVWTSDLASSDVIRTIRYAANNVAIVSQELSELNDHIKFVSSREDLWV